MYKTFQIFSILFIVSSMAFAQVKDDKNQVLLEVAGEKITKGEFLRTYFKNNTQTNKTINQADLDAYLDLYINYRLKVRQAKDLKLDTVRSFVHEYEKYRSQLAQPYLFDREVNDALIKEAYNRMKWMLRASHILIKLDANALPQDTLAAYQKTIEIRNKILKGMPFAEAADTYSEDPSARDVLATEAQQGSVGNHGDLGYFSVFDMVYPFETGAYNTKVGEISMPVRTSFGYHLIKVISKTPDMGMIDASHIMISTPQNLSAKDSAYYRGKINFIFTQLKEGANFESLAKEYSDDQATGELGGKIPAFTASRMVPEFIEAIIPLNNGEFSKPFLTRFGWHVALLINKEGIPAFDSIKGWIIDRITKDTRANKPKEVFVERLKSEYNFTENPKKLKEFYTVVTDSIFVNKWNRNTAGSLRAEMFHIGDKSYTQQDFVEYFTTQYRKQGDENVVDFLNRSYKDFVQKTCIQYEENQLDKKYDDYRNLANEYRDGFLLFDLTEKKVWNKAIEDTVGLETYYNENKSKYQWGERLSATLFEFEQSKIDEATASKIIKTAYKKKLFDKPEKLKAFLNKNIPNNDSLHVYRYEAKKYVKGDNRVIDKIAWTQGVTDPIKETTFFVIVAVQKVIPSEPKTFAEAKGLAIADYQNLLEQQWLKELKAEYPVVVHRDVYNTIK